MRKWLLFALVCSGLSCESKNTSVTSSAQKEDSAATRLKQLATELARAVVAGNFEKVVDFTYPKNVETAGGRDKLIASQNKTRQSMIAAGDQLAIDSIDEPGPIVEVKGTLYSYVQITARKTQKKGGFIYKIIFIAVSPDGGNNWNFIDDSALPKRDAIKSILPDFPDSLGLPPQQMPAPIDAPVKK